MLSNVSIKNKLIIITLTVAFFALGLGFTFMIISDIRSFRTNMIENTAMNARLIGEYSVTPLAFDDREGAEEILQKLHTIPQMMNGYIFDEQGLLFAAYSREGNNANPFSPDEYLQGFRDGSLYVASPIIYKKKIYGRIYLIASTRMLNEKIRSYLFTMLLLICGIMLVSYFLAVKLQKYLSGPILDLTGITKKISDEGDYSLRIERAGTDEIAMLYDSFNKMLKQVNLRESEIVREKEKLRKYLDTSAVIVVIIDTGQQVSLINKKGCEFLGHKEEEIIGSNWFDNFVSEEERQEAKKEFAAMISSNVDPVEYHEDTIVSRDGKKRLIAWYNTALRDERNNITAILSSGADITERKLAEDKIRESLHEKELLLREVHHRVKNNMQVIMSLLNLQADKIKDKYYAEQFNESRNRIKSMALVHEQLYRSEDIANIDFVDYVAMLSKNLLFLYEGTRRNIVMNTHVKSVSLGIDSAVPCGLLINELLSNCLKHAFPDQRKGVIDLDFRMTTSDEGRQEYDLIVKDDGVGIPESIDIRTTETLGFQLVLTLVEHQLGGSVELDRTTGSKFHIKFREPDYRKRI